MTKSTRPVHLNLLAIKFPVTAIVSILHRLSGIFLFLFIPLLLWMFATSLSGIDGFNYVALCLSNPLFKLFFLLILTALFYHLAAGIRHLLMDMGKNEKLEQARWSSYIVMGATGFFTVVAGIWLW